MKTYYATDNGGLHDYETGEYVRAATDDELRASREAAEIDGGAGVISADQLSAPAEAPSADERDERRRYWDARVQGATRVFSR
jgi:hypothetical protein